jgi:cobyrinic acid a,c-diamide synthase
MSGGLLIAAPASGSGKTVLTLGLLRAFRNRGLAVASVKCGPDYIDPAYHTAASGRPCANLDTWAMSPGLLADLARRAAEGAELVLGEGVMGLFDGAPDGRGSTADLARATGWPLILVVDARGLGASAAALVHGYMSYRPETRLAGLLFNRVGGAGHERLLNRACEPLGLPILGAVPRDDGLGLPERHLGLVQAGEQADLEAFLDGAAGLITRSVDLDGLAALAGPASLEAAAPRSPLPPLGQRIAAARDLAFAFAYPFVLDGWRAAGAEVSAFSPLADEAPEPSCDAVYLPGGYPELHGGRLAANDGFLSGLRAAAERGAAIYGECGGYMVLGRGLVDGDGRRHPMAGLLPLESSFAERRLSLGYRQIEVLEDGPLGPKGSRYRGHEFHYATTLSGEGGAPLFATRDSEGRARGGAGARAGRVAGSFVHLIDRDDA